MRSDYSVTNVNPATIRAMNHVPEMDRIRNRANEGSTSALGTMVEQLGRTFSKRVPRVDCSPLFGNELLGQVDILSSEPQGRVIREDRIPDAGDFRIKRWDVLIPGVGQLGQATLFGRAFIADGRLAGKLASEDIVILRFPNPGDSASLFTYALLCTNFGLRAIRSCAYGTSIPRIRLDLLSSLPVPRPDENLQERVAQFIRSAVEFRETYLREITTARGLIENQPDMSEAREMCEERKARSLVRDGALPTLQAWT